ncbi:MAG TPA: dTDP-4-dehydrorhamnose 3,5-epimerase [Actinomycetota bacterium]
MTPGPFPGLFLLDLVVREDAERSGASFREIYRAEELEAQGVPPFRPVQWNVSESERGTVRGIHAEPWDKLIHVTAGEVFSAVADVGKGSPTAGEVWTGRLDRTNAILVGAGLGNSFQVVSARATVVYLVTGSWRPDVSYPTVRFDDPDLAIRWPVTGEGVELSDKDRSAPSLRELWAD